MTMKAIVMMLALIGAPGTLGLPSVAESPARHLAATTEYEDNAHAHKARRDAVLHELATLDQDLDLEMQLLERSAFFKKGAALVGAGLKNAKAVMQEQSAAVIKAAVSAFKGQASATLAMVKVAAAKAKDVHKKFIAALTAIGEKIKKTGLNTVAAMELLKSDFISKYTDDITEYIEENMNDAPTAENLERWKAEDAQNLERLEGDELDLYLERRIYPFGGCIKGVVTASAAAGVGAAVYVEGGVCVAWTPDESGKLAMRAKVVLGAGMGFVAGIEASAAVGAGLSVGFGVPSECGEEDGWDECLGGEGVEKSQMIMFEMEAGFVEGASIAGFVETENGWPLVGKAKGGSIGMVGVELVAELAGIGGGANGRLLWFRTVAASHLGELTTEFLRKTFGSTADEVVDEQLGAHTKKCGDMSRKGCRDCLQHYTTLGKVHGTILGALKGKGMAGNHRCRWWQPSNGDRGYCSMHDQGGYYTSTKDEEIEVKDDCPKHIGPTPM